MARVKGETENDLQKLRFSSFYAFRPFLLTPTKGLTHTHGFYRFIKWFFPLGRWLYPKGFCTLQELGRAMIVVCSVGHASFNIEVKDIVQLAR
ncbi:hypothetical protein SAMN05421788_115106 [Filimonas lacunae]|uniref:Uncharacterized protein n=1 Tax=Filimonas lacunae TaxID=477680 RepID=A0A1N7RGN6_9BACT|nr:hypothetical protein [Filimonas lacunae]SIT34310.1 hypothetical protein SAMN05421788_115106 [Filimonas lacunae]